MTATAPRPSDYFDIELVINNQRVIMRALMALLNVAGSQTSAWAELERRVAIVAEREETMFANYDSISWEQKKANLR